MCLAIELSSFYSPFTASRIFSLSKKKKKKEIIFVIVPLILHFSRCLSRERIIFFFFFTSFNGSLLQNLYIYIYKGTINKVDKVILQKVTRANELNELDLASA